MATADVKSSGGSRGWLARRQRTRAPREQLRVLTASAALLDVADKTEIRRVRHLRQAWQTRAWDYYDDVGEVSYAHMFQANCASRMRIFPAAYPTGGFDEDPLPFAEIEGIPDVVVQVALDAMNALGVGRLSMSNLMESISTNLSVAGEGFILGVTDPADDSDTFSVRSISEILVTDDHYRLRELPTDSAGATEGIKLDPEHTYLARIWTPHPRWRLFARSQMRPALDICEQIQILNRMIRAAGRSRVAQNGLLLVPDTISAEGQDEENEDPEADPFTGRLAEAMMENISNEGDASATVPIVLRGPPDALDKIRQLALDRKLDPTLDARLDKLIGRLASTLDMPKEVMEGMADLNHWTAWQVSADTFSQHVEPSIVNDVDALTIGYLRPAMMSDPRMSGPDGAALRAWIPRVCAWYDPTELLTNPNRVADATTAHERMAISDEVFRAALGFSDTDAPEPAELLRRMVQATKTWPPNFLDALIHGVDPTLVIPALGVGGAVAGIPADPNATPEGSGADEADTGGADADAPPPVPAPPTSSAPATSPPGVAASAHPADAARLSRRLVDVDRDLRRSLQVACSAAVRRSLERAGAKMRTRVADAHDRSAAAIVSGISAERISLVLGPERRAAYATRDLIASDWSDVRSSFDAWVSSAQEQSLTIAHQLAGVGLKATAVARLRREQASSRSAAWDVLRTALDGLATSVLMRPEAVLAALKPPPPGSRLVIPPELLVGEPDSATMSGASIAVDPSTLVPTSTIRDVLSIAGGADPETSRVDPETGRVPGDADAAPLGQIGTGTGISDLLDEAGMASAGYQWVHGAAARDFEPHTELDGVEFSSFDDDALANAGDWPEVDYFVPGDHDGCTCDFMPLWAASDVGDRPVDQIDDGEDESGDEAVAASARGA